MRYALGILFGLWFVLKVLLHKGGYVHIILIAALSILVVKLFAYHKEHSQPL